MSRRERKALKNLKAEHAAQQKFDAEQTKKAEKAERQAQAKADWEAKSPEEKKKIYKILGAIAAVIIVIIAIAAACGGDDSKDSASTGAAESATADQSQDDGAPKAPKDVDFSEQGDVVFASFQISDSLTKGSIRRGAQLETIKILEYAKSAYPEATRVFVQGSFPMKDSYGNTDDSQILNVGYDRATLDKINFDGVDPSKIWELRDAGMVHRELQG